MASLVLLSARSGDADRPLWENPANGVRLLSRDVIADPSLPLPSDKAAFYVFTDRALSRADIEELDRAGLRYLGLVSTRVYTFLAQRTGNDPRAALAAIKAIKGTNLVEPQDRLNPDVLRWLGNTKEEHLPMPLRVGFYPHATRAEITALVSSAAERMRLPRDPNEPVREARHLLVPWTDATPALLDKLAHSPFVGRVGFDHPRIAFNAASRALSNADQIIAAPLSLTGAGVVVGHWDGGAVSAGHQDFGGRVTLEENNGVDSHATHTAGTILGSGAGNPDARGYATSATMVAYDFYGDPPSERRSSKHANYHQHDNHSWGSDSGSFGGYEDVAVEFDEDGRDDLLLAVKSAGNDGQRSEVVDQNYGFDSLSSDSTGKNVLIIGATQDDGDLASFSSRGPTNDGRMKPDISANGDNLLSTVPGNSYDSYSGTSMSAPSITGMIALLSELFQRENGRRWAPDETRAVMLHTVLDVFHPGPDYRHGWGNADAAAAAALIQADAQNPGQQLARGAVREGETIEYSLEVPAGAPEVKVTMTWLDSNAASTASRVLVSDLDLLLIDPSGTSHYPWTLDPANPFTNATQDKKNALDNIEQVIVTTPAAGTWTIRVSGAAVPDPDLDVQGFVLASSLPTTRSIERVTAQIAAGGEAVPDNNPAGVQIQFAVTDTRMVKGVRLTLELRAEERGQVQIELAHPDGTRVTLEAADTATRQDIYSVFPDLRSLADDVTGFYGRAGNGNWTATISDTRAGGDVVVLGASIEVDLDGPVLPPNMPPVANAGADQVVNSGASAMLDGSLSNDPEGFGLTFAWTQVMGMPVTLSGADTAMPTFTAPTVDADEALVFRLVVTDVAMATAMDDVTINVKGRGTPVPGNNVPVARISGPMTAMSGDQIHFDASGSSDPDGDPLTFAWTQSAGMPVTLDGASTAMLGFIAPDTTEMITLAFRVEVADGRGGSDLEDATLIVTPRTGGGNEQPGGPGQMMPPAGSNDARPNGAIAGSCVCNDAGAPQVFDPRAALALMLFALAFRRRS